MITESTPTIRRTLEIIRKDLCMSIVRKDGEWKINYPGGKEATAYYTEDNADAIATAAFMKRDLELALKNV